MSTVSVVIPAHRIDDWLALAVASVLDSTGIDVELIVVLDGVVGDAPSWADDERVTLLRRSVAGGPAPAMNEGMTVARGEFIARLDSDDLSRADRFALQVAHLREHPDAVAVGSGVALIDEAGADIGHLDLPSADDVRPSLLLYNVVPHSSLLFRAEAMRTVGPYDETLRVMEDYEFILRLATLGPVAQLADRLVSYREHPGQISREMAPTGPHIDRVLAARRALAASIGANRLVSALRDAAWLAVRRWRSLVATSRLARRRMGTPHDS